MSEYSLRKKIEELERDLREATRKKNKYEEVMFNIFDMLTNLKDGEYYRPLALLQKFRNLLYL